MTSVGYSDAFTSQRLSMDDFVALIVALRKDNTLGREAEAGKKSGFLGLR